MMSGTPFIQMQPPSQWRSILPPQPGTSRKCVNMPGAFLKLQLPPVVGGGGVAELPMVVGGVVAVVPGS